MTISSPAATLASTRTPATSDAANRRGILAMIASMGVFVCNDTCVKLASASMPIGEIITMRNGLATLYLGAFCVWAGGLTWPPNPPKRLLAFRVTGELVSTILFLVALVSLPLPDMTAISQFTPLALTAAAALILREPVGWRRWSATVAGLIGVALIVRPGSSSFSVAGALVLLSVVFVVMRDLATRLISASISTPTLTMTSTVSGTAAGLLLLPFETWQIPSTSEAMLIGLSGLFLTFGYALIIIALRTGEVGIVSPFRYSVILFALASGYLVWGDIPDQLAMFGIVILCAAGVYTVHRERLTRAGTPQP